MNDSISGANAAPANTWYQGKWTEANFPIQGTRGRCPLLVIFEILPGAPGLWQRGALTYPAREKEPLAFSGNLSFGAPKR